MEKAPFIGQLNRKIKIVELISTPNSTGEMEPVKNEIAAPFSYMEDSSGNEDVEGKIRHVMNRFYVIRFSDVIKNKGTELMVIDGTKEFDIYHIQEIGRRKHLKLLVRDYE
jgi:hypothetical protein